MRNTMRPFFFALFLLVPAAIFAQGSGSSEPNNKPKAFAVTRSVTGVLSSRSGDSIVIEVNNGKKLTLGLTGATRFVGKPAVGLRVRATYQTKNRRATVVRKL